MPAKLKAMPTRTQKRSDHTRKKNRCMIEYTCLDPKCDYIETEGMFHCNHLNSDGDCTNKFARKAALIKDIERLTRKKVELV